MLETSIVRWSFDLLAGVFSFLSLLMSSLRGDAMMSSSLAWQLFVACVSVAEIAVFALGAVLVATYMVTLWQARARRITHRDERAVSRFMRAHFTWL